MTETGLIATFRDSWQGSRAKQIGRRTISADAIEIDSQTKRSDNQARKR